MAAVVKIARTLCIMPVCLALGVMRLVDARRTRATAEIRPLTSASGNWKRAVPWFVLGFLLCSSAHSMGLWGDVGAAWFSRASQLFTLFAVAAIGLATDVRQAVKAGASPFILGLSGWLLVASSSLAFQVLAKAV